MHPHANCPPSDACLCPRRLEREAAELVGGLLAEGSLLTHYSSVLEIILRLRQVGGG